MNEKKIAAILCREKNEEYKHIIDILNTLAVPSGFQLEIIMISGGSNLAAMYNKALQQTDAKYKIYFGKNIRNLNKYILNKILFYFALDPKISILGLYGSELPLDADYLHAKRVYGSYYYQKDSIEKNDVEGTSVYMQNVHTIDGSFFATCKDDMWDVSMDGPFLLASYCCMARQNGEKVVVAMQNVDVNDIWVVLSEEPVNKIWCDKKKKYDEYRLKFIKKYKKKYLPLVSILIPAYNQPKFFEQALNCALNQTYGNIEILVGDDSTNESIDEIIQPYLVKYKNIKYYHHGKPMGRNGICNMDFLIEKSSGEYIKFIFQDDLIFKNNVMKMMEYYIYDLNSEIGIVTSSRYLIDENNKILMEMPGFIRDGNQIVSGDMAGQMILRLGMNYIGEFSTVLLPRRAFYHRQTNTYKMGVYHGLVDSSMADLSTWLEVFRKGRKLVRIAEPLSAFRWHKAQNTYKNIIQIRARLDWLAFYVLSWRNDDFIHDINELIYLCKHFLYYNQLKINYDELYHDERDYLNKYMDCISYIDKDDIHGFVDCILQYIRDNSI